VYRLKLTIESARKKWARQSANLALRMGERLKLIHRFSLEAEQLRTQPNGPSEREIRLAFCEIFTDPAKGRKINILAVQRYMRFQRLSPEVVEMMAAHASRDSEHSIGLSYGLELSEVGDQEAQMALLKSAIDEKWTVRKLREMAEPHRDIATVPKESRHAVAFGKIETAAIDMHNQLTELTMAFSLLDSIGDSPHRTSEEAESLTQKIVHIGSLLDDICQMQDEVSDILDLAATRVRESAE